jgi:tetratricopeptide (TPR) repeat protein
MAIFKKALLLSTAFFCLTNEAVGMLTKEEEEEKNKGNIHIQPKTTSSTLSGEQTVDISSIKSAQNLYYEDHDISEYLNNFFQQKNNNFTLFEGFKYLLSSEKQKFSAIFDQVTKETYIVAVTPAIDTLGLRFQTPLLTGGSASSTNIDYFFDKNTHPIEEKEEVLKTLVNFNPDTYLDLLQKIEEIKKDKKLEFIQDICQEKKENLKDILNEFNSQLHLIRQKKQDIFDEVFLFFKEPQYTHVKILFPYNVTQAHWLTGEILIHRDEHNYKINIYTHDPYGKGKMAESNFSKITEAVKKRIKEHHSTAEFNSIENLESSHGRRQEAGDVISCGVITAEDLIKRITGQPIGNEVYPIGAKELRKYHIEIVRKINPNAAFIGRNEPRVAFITKRSNENNSESITNVFNEQVLKSKKEEDLESLLNIYELCKNFVNKPNNVIDVLKKIGTHAKINHDMGDKGCIRNKYSTVDAFGNERELRKNGVNLVELQHLISIIDNKSLQKITLHPFFEEIKKDFNKINNKILYIFSQEQKSLDENCELIKKIKEICIKNDCPTDLGEALSFIPKLSNFFYDQLILESVLNELKLFKDLTDFSTRENRYFWGRLLVKVGEFLHPDELSDSYDLLQCFRPITGLRAKLIHSHRLLINTEQTRQQSFYQHAQELFNTLEVLILQLKENLSNKPLESFERFKFSDLNKEIPETLDKKARKFLSFFNAKSDNSSKKESVHQITQQKNKVEDNNIFLDQFIMRAAAYLNQKNSSKKKTKNSSTLESLANQYQELLKKIPLPFGYPKELNEENKENILRIAENRKKQSEEKKKKDNSIGKEKKQQSNEEKVLKLIQKITKEIEYIRNIEKGIINVSEEKKPYIIQHAETVIGEYEREILKSKNSTLMEKKTITLEESSHTAILQRNKGLGHEPLSLDHEALLQGLHTNVLPAYEDYRAIYTFGQNSISIIPQTAVVLNRVGEALLRLCFYKEAIKYFQEALQDIQDTSNISNSIHSRTKVDQYKLDSIGITQPTTICIDMTKVLFGVDTYELSLTNNLVHAFLLNGDLENAYKIASQLSIKFNLEKLEKYKNSLYFAAFIKKLNHNNNSYSPIFENLQLENPELMETYNNLIDFIKNTQAPFFIYYPKDSEIFDQFSGIFSRIAYAYYKQGNDQKAAELYEQALKLAGSESVRINIASQLSHIYYKIGNEIKCKEYIELVIKDGSLLDQISVRILKCSMQLDKKNLEAENEIKLLSTTINKNKGNIKDEVGDRFWICQLGVCELNLHLSVLKNANYKEVSQYIKDALKIVKELKKSKRFSCEISTFYCYASQALSHLISHNPKKISIEILEEAEKYFKEGIKEDSLSLMMIKGATGRELAIAFSNYVLSSSKLPFNKRIQLLKKVKRIQESYKIETHATNLNLGCEYHNQAEEFYKQKNYKEATNCYKEAIDVLNLLLDKNNSETLKVLAMCYEGLGDCEGDINSLTQAKDLYFQFLKLYQNNPDCHLVKSYAEGTLRKIQILMNNKKK